ncbi:MAG TPA: hypothetical protein DHV30_13240 [Balneola sp.]|nr:hypothetical protein [Balneola sp.]
MCQRIMNILLIIGYCIASLIVLIMEYISIVNGHNVITHLILIGFLTWNGFVVIGFNKQKKYAQIMIKIGSYFQLIVILIGTIFYLVGSDFSIILDNQNRTVFGSIAIITWAIFKLFVTKRHYTNT